MTLAALVSVLAVSSVRAQVPSTGGQVWSIGNLWVPLPSKFRALVTGEWNAGTDYSYQQFLGGAGIGFRWKRVSKLAHMVNINADKESRLVVGAGYEYVWTDQLGATTDEDRIVFDVTPRYRPKSHWLLDWRNRAELRWVDGDYSTRLRTRITVERDIPVRKGGRLTPYASAEFFYNFASDSWDKQQYAIGVEIPFRRVFMVQAYYLYQHNSSAPDNVNVLGITLNFFLRNAL